MSERQITRDMHQPSEQDELMHRWSMTIDGETVSELWVATDRPGEAVALGGAVAGRRVVDRDLGRGLAGPGQ